MGSFSTFTERLNFGVRMLVPYAFMAFLFLLNIVAVSYPLTGAIKAPFFLMAIYYWAIFRPTLIPAWLVFIAGILMDLLSGLPLGMNALPFLVIHWIVADQRRYLLGQPFLMLWIIFCLLSLGAVVLQWLLYGLIHMHWPSLIPLWAPSLLGIALFPLICVMLHLTHKILPAPARAFRLGAQG
jgi:rod shape-determining protein MreD